jgi:ArpU family phage transcriptional regulator
MSFKVSEIDHYKTRERVEEYIDTALAMRDTDGVRKETAMTPNYAPRDYTSNAQTGKPVEDAAIANVEADAMRQHWIMLQRALLVLRPEERRLIELRYLGEDTLYDYQVYNQMGMSDRTYKRLKNKAIKRLAIKLNIEVWK